ncbi:YncE family protein [Paracoccus aminovorans]|uniref:YncE family protein n=1 Tax=Paracoccus aminovorans TaxID=34004 RepID=UPI002B2636D0|nr:YncE family protein [Paracoccus aminovorans]
MRHSSLRLGTAILAALLTTSAIHAEQAAPGAAPAAAVQADKRILRAELAPALYELVYSPSQNAVFVASAGGFGPDAPASKILRLDPETLAVQAEIRLEGKGFGLGLDDEAGRLYAGDTTDAAVHVIDIAANRVIGKVRLAEKVKDEEGNERPPHNIRELVLDPAHHRLYAPGLAFKDSALYVVDTQALKPEKVVPGLGFVATGVAHDPAADRLYVTNQQGELYTLDTGTLEVLGKAETSGDQLLNLALDAAGGRIFATDQGLTKMDEIRRESLPDYAPRGKGGQVLVLNPADGTTLRALPTGEGPIAPLFDAARKRLYVTGRGDGSVSVFDTDSYALVEKIDLPAHPNSLALDAKSGALFVTVKNGEDAAQGSAESVVRIGL